MTGRRAYVEKQGSKVSGSCIRVGSSTQSYRARAWEVGVSLVSGLECYGFGLPSSWEVLGILGVCWGDLGVWDQPDIVG